MAKYTYKVFAGGSSRKWHKGARAADVVIFRDGAPYKEIRGIQAFGTGDTDQKKAMRAGRERVAELKQLDKYYGRSNAGRRNPQPKHATFFRFSGGGGTYQGWHNIKGAAQAHADATGRPVVVESAKGGNAWKHYKTLQPKRGNPGASISGWVKAKAVKVVRDAKGRAISLKIRT